MEKIGSDLDLTEWMDAVDDGEAKNLRGSGSESLSISIRAQGGDPDTSKAVMKKDARVDKAFKCDALHFTYKVKQIIPWKDKKISRGCAKHSRDHAGVGERAVNKYLPHYQVSIEQRWIVEEGSHGEIIWRK